MDFVQIGAIVLDDLEDPKQLEWLMSLPDDENYNFIEVTEGDASCVRAIDTSLIYTFEDLIDSSYCDSSYIAVDKQLTAFQHIRILDQRRDRAKSFWSDMIYYQPVAG